MSWCWGGQKNCAGCPRRDRRSTSNLDRGPALSRNAAVDKELQVVSVVSRRSSQPAEVREPAHDPVPTGAGLVHHLQVVDSKRMKSATHFIDRTAWLTIALCSGLQNRLLQDIRSLDPTASLHRRRVYSRTTHRHSTGGTGSLTGIRRRVVGVFAKPVGPDLLLDAIRVALGAGPSHGARPRATTEGMNTCYPVRSPLNQGLSV